MECDVMYGVDIASYNSNFDDEKKDTDLICLFLKEVLGYNDHEVKGFDHWLFYPPLAMNLTKEEVRMIMQPFYDNNISVWAFKIDEETGEYIMPDFKGGYMTSKFFGIVSQPPQEHYYDAPVVTRDKLIDPWNPPTNNPEWIHPNLKSKIQVQSSNIPKCPTCGSTNVHKISTGKKALGFVTVGIFSSNFGKSYECLQCKYKW